VRIKRARHSGHAGKMAVHDPLKYHGESLEEHYNAKRKEGVVGRFAWLV